MLARFRNLSDAQLLTEVRTLTNHERVATAELIASLAEFDARRLYLGEGCSSLFTYCTQALHLSEHAAYGRIEAARAAKRFPVILDLLADGSITLTTVSLLGRHLTIENHATLLDSARHTSKRDVEHIVARIHPSPPVEPSVRRLPAPKPATVSADCPQAMSRESGAALSQGPLTAPSPAAPTRPAVMKPTAPERYSIHLTVSEDTYKKLRRAQDLIRHIIPNADPAAIFERALTLLVAQLEQTKFAATARPRAARQATSGSRHIPAAVRREVWSRDGGQCAFVGSTGRCTERGFLEFHHVTPFADGGQTVTANLELRCRAHNAYESEQHFGSLFVRERAVPYGSPRTRSWTEFVAPI